MQVEKTVKTLVKFGRCMEYEQRCFFFFWKIYSKIYFIFYSTEVLDILNVKVLNDPVYCNICIGQSFVNFSDLTFFIFQPMLLFQYGYDSVRTAYQLHLLFWMSPRNLSSILVMSLNIKPMLVLYSVNNRVYWHDSVKIKAIVTEYIFNFALLHNVL